MTSQKYSAYIRVYNKTRTNKFVNDHTAKCDL